MAAVSVWVPVSHAEGRPLRGRGEGERAGEERPRAQVGADPRSGVGTAEGRDPGQASPERRRAGQAVGPHKSLRDGSCAEPDRASPAGGCKPGGAAQPWGCSSLLLKASSVVE